MGDDDPPLFPSDPEWLEDVLLWTVRTIEIAGILVIVLGASFAVGVFLYRTVREGCSAKLYRGFRSTLGRAILLGLEFLVGADIIMTVVVEPSFESLAVLASVVGIRTFLSFALEVEIDGRWPWANRRDG